MDENTRKRRNDVCLDSIQAVVCAVRDSRAIRWEQRLTHAVTHTWAHVSERTEGESKPGRSATERGKNGRQQTDESAACYGT